MDCPHGQSVARSAAPFGNWITTYTRFRDWAKAGVWKRMFDAVSDESEMEYVMLDATIVKVTATDKA